MLDRSVYEAIKKKHEEKSLGDITEIVDVALDETKLIEFLKRDNVDIEINKEISIEVEGERERKHTYMLHLALENKFHPNTIKLMLEKGALLLKQDSSGNNPIFIAIDREQNESLAVILKFAAESGFDSEAIGVDEINQLGMTPLQYLSSLKKENRTAVKLLLKAGVDIWMKNEKENSLNALHYAVFAGNIITTRLILESIDDIAVRREYIKSVDEHGRTALHFASVLGNMKIWSLLVDKLEDEIYTFIQDKIGATELHYAGLHKEIISELRKRGERVKPKLEVLFPYSAKGFSLDVLCEKVFKVESVNFMRSPESFGYSRPEWDEVIRGGKENESLFLKTNQGGLTPLHYVVLTGNIELLELAIAKLGNVVLNEEFVLKHSLRTYIPLEREEEKRKELIREATPFDMACIAGKTRVVEHMLGLLRVKERSRK